MGGGTDKAKQKEQNQQEAAFRAEHQITPKTFVEVEGNHLKMTTYDENQNEPRDAVQGKVKKILQGKGGHNAPELNLEIDDAVIQVRTSTMPDERCPHTIE